MNFWMIHLSLLSFSIGIQQPFFPPKFISNYYSEYKDTYGVYALSPHSQLIVFANGYRDHLCRSQANNTECWHLTTEGFRYLSLLQVLYLYIWKLSLWWTFEQKMVNGELCWKWNAVGLNGDPNYYYELVNTPIPCEIDGYNYLTTPAQRSDDQYIFELSSFKIHFDDQKVFHVPEICEDVDYCGNSVCATGP
eukprot:maker-scaffold_7-snap-gene-16.8-mRNA-1 protein AED:0.33 eAED:0.33 QI:0/0/0/1/1/1/3/0/192